MQAVPQNLGPIGLSSQRLGGASSLSKKEEYGIHFPSKYLPLYEAKRTFNKEISNRVISVGYT